MIAGNYEITLDVRPNYGFFEHNTRGEDSAGGLWFEGKTLTDYDGVWELPKQVVEGLEKAGYIVGECFK